MSKKTMLFIEGMTCVSCEKRVEKALQDLAGVINVKASHDKARVEIEYDNEVQNENSFRKAVESLGYSVFDKPQNTFGSMMPLIIILFAIYYIINNTIGFQFIPEISQGMGYSILFVAGLLTSVHCIAMCGGIALSQSIKQDEKKNNLRTALLYNAGRVLSYTIIGGIVGSLGAVVSPSGQFKGIVAMGAGGFMFLFGLKMLNLFSFPAWMKIKLPEINIMKASKENHARPFLVGLANGFMPCGPLQTMQLYALGTGSALMGAMSMFVFSIGTVPLMLGLGFLTSLISGKMGKKMLRASAAMVMVLGIIMVNRGLALSGISMDAGLSKTAVDQSYEIRMEDGKQIVNLTIGSRAYVPDVKVLQAGIPVRINLAVESINGCNNPIAIPKYGIEKDLGKGDAFIEFTPTEEGSLTISCWMGMITTKLTVVDDPSQALVTQENADSSSPCGELDTCIGVSQSADTAVKAVIDGSSQTVEMNVGIEGYSPNILIVQKGLQTNWIINGQDMRDCSNQLVIPDAAYVMDLKEGNNEIKFTPQETGEINFTCGMNMLYGKIVIVEDLEKVNIEDYQ